VVTGRPLLGGPHPRGGADHGLGDELVAGAAAQVAGDGLADLVRRRVGVLREDLAGPHQHAGGAVAALQALLLRELVLEGMQPTALGEALDGVDGGAVRLDGQGDAGADAGAVQQHGAGPADAVLAADVGAGQAEVLAEEVDEQAARFYLGHVRLAVDGQADRAGIRGHRCHLSFRARATASSIPRRR
jgi:hypothetical protein